ncbi:MAG: hypothetical protein PVG41_06510 [Desulfobacteraceae bacterium]|jgi:hypothetical protein
MTTSDASGKRPFWLSVEERILALDSQDLSGGNMEASIQRIAGELDDAGYNVSRHGGNMIKVRFAVDKAGQAGKPFLQDFNTAVSALTLDDVADPFAATNNLLDKLSETWPEIRSAERRPDVVEIVEQTKLDLMIAKAKEMQGDEGIRYLIEEAVDFQVITKALEITDEKLNEVHEQIKAERKERERVAGLLEKVADKTNEEKVRHLFDNNVTEALIMEMAGVDQGVLDAVKKAMEEEMKEKQRLAEEEAARKKKEAEGPSLDDMTSEEMLDHIESIREIMEFSDQEKDIRTMCEQSAIPKALVDIAVSDPDKLDELEKKAEG